MRISDVSQSVSSPTVTCCWKISLVLQRHCSPTHLLVHLVVSSSVFNSHLTCSLPTLWGPTCTTKNLENSSSVQVHCFPTFFSLTKSTVHLQRHRLHCSKQWKKSKSPSKVSLTNFLLHSLFWQHKTQSSKKVPIPFLKRKWTVS